MSIGSVKPGGVCAKASGCTGGGECVDDDGVICVLKTLGNALHTAAAAVDVFELNHA